ncbi:MAG: transcription antitermination factor NusB [Planctomycetota bacterium]|nr:transcription antitermination factor NusB [Planctomycetota bacterium]
MNEIQPNARDIAVWALRDQRGNVTAHLNRVLAKLHPTLAEASLARELTLGVVRRRATLDTVLRTFLKQPDKCLPGPLREILYVGLYQLLFLQRVPGFAAVNEAVRQAVQFRHKRQSGFVNGVLRAVARSVSELVSAAPTPAANVIPIAPAEHRTLDRAVFPDPSADAAGFLAAAYSLPAILGRRWIERFGSLEKAVSPAMHANVRAPVVLRVNKLKADVEQVLASLSADGAEAQPHSNGCSVVLDAHTDVTKLAAFREGWVQPQDPTATAVVHAADPAAGMDVLDFCAAPGTKTTHLAEQMRNRGSITAVDVSHEKLRRIEDNCRRMDDSIVKTHLAEQAGSLKPQSFDLVMVDAPCSNTGVLSRRPEARWRFSEEHLATLVKDQQLLLQAAAAFVKPGRRLVYSTCSIEPEECADVTAWLQKHTDRASLVHEQLTLPAGADNPLAWCDGGYTAVFEMK